MITGNYTDDEAGSSEVTFHSVHYDVEQAAMSARAKDRPDVEHALRIGRMPDGSV